MSIAPPVPGHLHTLDLPSSGIDVASTTNRWRPPLYPENEAPKTPGDEAAGLSTPK